MFSTKITATVVRLSAITIGVLTAINGHANVVNFAQTYNGTPINYSVDDQALTVTVQPFSIGFATQPTSIVTKPVQGTGPTSVTYNLPNHLPLTSVTNTFTDSVVIDSVQFTWITPPSPSTTTSATTQTITLPTTGTVGELSGGCSLIDNTCPLKYNQGLAQVELIGHWSLGDPNQTVNGTFDLSYDIGGPTYCTPAVFSGIQLANYPSSAPLVNGPTCEGGWNGYLQSSLFTGVIDGFSADLLLSATSSYSVQSGSLQTRVSMAPLPIPPALWLFGSALGLLGLRRRKT